MGRRRALAKGAGGEFDVVEGEEDSGAKAGGAAALEGTDGLMSQGSAVEAGAGEEAELVFEHGREFLGSVV